MFSSFPMSDTSHKYSLLCMKMKMFFAWQKKTENKNPIEHTDLSKAIKWLQGILRDFKHVSKRLLR